MGKFQTDAVDPWLTNTLHASRTVMIATVSPCASSADHTVNTLRYADRVKEKHVSADAFDESSADAAPLEMDEVQLETGTESVFRAPVVTRLTQLMHILLFPDNDECGDLPDGYDETLDDSSDIDDMDQAEDREYDGDEYVEGEDVLASDKADESLPPSRPSRSASASSEDIKLLHKSLRRHSSALACF